MEYLWGYLMAKLDLNIINPTKGDDVMDNWYLMCYQHRVWRRLLTRLDEYKVQYCCPMQREARLRTDKINSVRNIEYPLFPGYIFLRFNPEVIHTSKMLQIPGASYFVRFGNELRPIPHDVVAELGNCNDHVKCTYEMPKSVKTLLNDMDSFEVRCFVKKLKSDAELLPIEQRGSYFVESLDKYLITLLNKAFTHSKKEFAKEIN